MPLHPPFSTNRQEAAAGRRRYAVLLVWVVLTVIYWGNIFRFHPSLIDLSYDSTSEELVIGRMARAAADGLFRDTDLGANIDPNNPLPVGHERYRAQQRYFEDPSLVHSLRLQWGIYPSHFALQGFALAAMDMINPLPRQFRIAFYHFLMCGFAAGVLTWIANILRRRFGWPAFFGFLIPPALEPMFTAMAPNLYWVMGLWFVPMGIAMLLADEDRRGARAGLISAAFLFFLVKFLCGYEFTSTIILAAATGCLLGVKDVPDRLRHVLRDSISIVTVGVAAFVVAALAHAAKQGGFEVLVEKAANRLTGDASSLQEELVLGKFVSIGTVIWNYFGGNYVSLIKNFGLLLALLAVYAVVTLLDGKYNWFLGPDRRKLQTLALAFLVSIAAPLSWFVLGKAHASAHLSIDLILWYVPTLPLGCAMIAVALAQSIKYRALWKVDATRSWITAGVPVVIIGLIVAVVIADKRIRTQGTWAIAAHAKGLPIFESEELGLQFRMTDQWFTVQYPCSAVGDGQPFFIRAQQQDSVVNYDFTLIDKQIISGKAGCISAQAKSDRVISRIHFGEISKQGMLWERDEPIRLPDSFRLEQLTDSEWDHGINRSTRTELLLRADTAAKLFLRTGDRIEFPSSDRRTITGISPVGPYKRVSIDSAVGSGEVGNAALRIVRQ